MASFDDRYASMDLSSTATEGGQSSVNKIHPAFSASDADIILCSADNVLFRIHSVVLKLASGWFRTLFSLPQQQPPPPKIGSPPEIIRMVESSDVLAGLFGIICGQEAPKLDSIEYVDSLLQAAEKFDVPGVLSVIRLAIVSPAILDTYPIRVYGIACRWGWVEEAKIASSKTVTLDLLSLDVVKDLSTIGSSHLTKLMMLHRRRRDALKAGLDSSRFSANSYPAHCTSCQREVAHIQWQRAKYAWMVAIEQTPVDIVSQEVLQHPELHEVLAASCGHCLKKLYNPVTTVNNLRTILRELPSVVEMD